MHVAIDYQVLLLALFYVGEFGRMFNGMWIHKHDDGSYKSQDVAIKTVKG